MVTSVILNMLKPTKYSINQWFVQPFMERKLCPMANCEDPDKMQHKASFHGLLIAKIYFQRKIF